MTLEAAKTCYVAANVHIVDQAAYASAVLNADAKRGARGNSSNRQRSKCWSAGVADSGLLRLSTTTEDVAIPGRAYIVADLLIEI